MTLEPLRGGCWVLVTFGRVDSVHPRLEQVALGTVEETEDGDCFLTMPECRHCRVKATISSPTSRSGARPAWRPVRSDTHRPATWGVSRSRGHAGECHGGERARTVTLYLIGVCIHVNNSYTRPRSTRTVPNLVYLAIPRREGLYRSRLARLASPSTQAGCLQSANQATYKGHKPLARDDHMTVLSNLRHGDTRQRCPRAGCNNTRAICP